MPELNFVLPHWLYWNGLILFPIIAFTMVRLARRPSSRAPVSLSLGYFLLLTGGFAGVHRIYLKSRWALVFFLLFIVLLAVNVETRESRNDLSSATNAVHLVELKIKRAEQAVAKGKRRAAERLAKAQPQSAPAAATLVAAQAQSDKWQTISSTLGVVLLLLIITDALLFPWLVRRRNACEQSAAELDTAVPPEG